MGFLSGRVTAARYQVMGDRPGLFGPEHLERLAEFSAGKKALAPSDGVEVGWSAGDHILDTRFTLEKNIVNESLHFCLRVDSQKVPSDLLRAYYQIELEGLTASNPSGRPSARQKREAKEAALARLDKEARDGRFLRRKAIPIMWDARSNELLVGTTSVTAIDQLYALFERCFGTGFESLSAGRLAYRMAEGRSQTRGVDDAEPSQVVPGMIPKDLAWIPDQDSRDFLGNEFLLWLWYTLDSNHDAIKAADGSEITVMLSRTLTLECPRGQTGYETITHEGPTRLPEARRAIQSGKLPRKVGLTLVRHDAQYDLTVQAETLAIGSSKMPPIDEENERARLDARIDQIRHLVESLDLLFDAFVHVRCGKNWSPTLTALQAWLAKGAK